MSEQEFDKCPRCGRYTLKKDKYKNALSRHSDMYICDECGMDEALRDFAGEVLPFEEWDMNK